MPTPVGFADCSINILLQGDPDPFAITHGVSTNLGVEDAQAHADAVFGAFAGAWQGFLTNLASIESATCRFGQDGGDDLIIDSSQAPVPGTNAAPPMPQNCAILVRKNTGLGGRRNRGRVYIPSSSDESVVSATGTITAAQVTAMQSAVDSWLTNLETSTGAGDPAVPMVILHRATVLEPTPPAPTPVISLTVDPVIATQRRRLRR